jgi:hypothetical protein
MRRDGLRPIASLTSWSRASCRNPRQIKEVTMTNMPIDFFRALRSAKISADEAQKVVESLEGHIAVKISEANASLVGELKSMRKDMSTLRWLQVTAISLSVIAGTIGGYAAAIIK